MNNEFYELKVRAIHQKIDEILKSIGVPYLNNYFVKERIERLIAERGELSHEGPQLATYGLNIFERFEAWGERTKKKSHFAGDHFTAIVLFEWLCQESNSKGLAGYGSSPDFIYFLFDIVLENYFSNIKLRTEIYKTIRIHLDAAIIFLKTYKSNERWLSFEQRERLTIIHDHINQIFKGEEPGVLEEYEQAEDKLEFYFDFFADQKRLNKLIKMDPFKVYRNLSPILIPNLLFPVFIEVDYFLYYLGYNILALLLVISIECSVLLMSIFFYLKQQKSPWIPVGYKYEDRYSFIYLLSFWLVSLVLNWFTAHLLFPVAAQLWQSPWLLEKTLSFTLVLFQLAAALYIQLSTAPTLVGHIFSFIRGRLLGLGAVTNWRDIKKKYQTASERFSGFFSKDQKEPQKCWEVFWRTYLNDHLHKDFFINNEELQSYKRADFSNKPKDTHALGRLIHMFETLFFPMPKILSWDDMPGLTVLITAMNERISYKLDELDSPEYMSQETRLSKLITQYPIQWKNFIGSLKESHASDCELLQEHTRYIEKEKKALRLLPHALTIETKNKIERWANLRTVTFYKTLHELKALKDAFKFIAKNNFSEKTDQELDLLVASKLQVLVNYQKFYSVSKSQQDDLLKLMKELPFFEFTWWEYFSTLHLRKWSDEEKKIITIGTCPFGKPLVPGKSFGQSTVLPFCQHEKILMLDSNMSLFFEDAIRIPLLLTEFWENPSLKLISCQNRIFNSSFTWVSQAIGVSEELWTTDTQRFLNMFRSVGFYGHSGIVDREALLIAGGLGHGYIAEDVLLSTKIILSGYQTGYGEYVTFGKSREVTFFSALTPLGRWARGSAELLLSQWCYRLVRSPYISLPQKMVTFFWQTFFERMVYILFLMFILNFSFFALVISRHGTHSAHEFRYNMGIALITIVGIEGMIVLWLHLINKRGFFRSIKKFFEVYPLLLGFYSTSFPTIWYNYAKTAISGSGGKFDMSSKSFGLVEPPLIKEKGDIIFYGMQTILGLSMGLAFIYTPQNPFVYQPEIINPLALLWILANFAMPLYLILLSITDKHHPFFKSKLIQIKIQTLVAIPLLISLIVSYFSFADQLDRWLLLALYSSLFCYAYGAYLKAMHPGQGNKLLWCGFCFSVLNFIIGIAWKGLWYLFLFSSVFSVGFWGAIILTPYWIQQYRWRTHLLSYQMIKQEMKNALPWLMESPQKIYLEKIEKTEINFKDIIISSLWMLSRALDVEAKQVPKMIQEKSLSLQESLKVIYEETMDQKVDMESKLTILTRKTYRYFYSLIGP